MNRAILAILAVCALVVPGAALGASATLAKATVVKVGERQSFTRSELRPGATVRCSYRGHSLALIAPVGKREGNAAAWPAGQTRGFYLNVIGKPGGSYAVTCALGSSALVL